ncbi:hypothetical protein [Salinibacterium sp. UTAS2018]|uniref:hypothetical protein n=1 Tax=Salinibacterium sp. UTAS2018 TaxID=2508880 RepID=UPI001AEF511D|nr:hypothetical protein [Salinibacterium sp. UTAS2018]
MSSVLRPTGRSGSTTAPDRTLLIRRLAFVIPGGIALLGGLDAALLLLGLPAPVTTERLPLIHAPLMVFAFIGTLVVLERAVAARRWWGFLSPLAFGLGGFALLSTLPFAVGQASFVLGFVVLLAIYGVVWARQASMATAIQVLGALSGLASAILWLSGVIIPLIAPSMVAFLVLTIFGERLELARISPTVNAKVERLAFACGMALSLTALAAPLWPVVGYPLFGVAMLATVAWLFSHDVATRLARSTGLARYMAVCLLLGYGWLVVAGGIWLVGGAVTSGPAYDAVLHAVFLGFVMSMVMAHAPVILPAVIRRPLPYRWFLYLPVALLHASLAVRVLIGDGRGIEEAVQWGGALNVVAVLAFVVLAVASAIAGAPRVAKNEVVA